MKKINPLDLSSREEIGHDEMKNMIAQASGGTSGLYTAMIGRIIFIVLT